jgi:HK97 family phage prohead protease
MPATFSAGRKALDTTELRSGDLLLEGLAVVWDGEDFENESFARGALRETIPAFLSNQAPLLWNHRPDLGGIGRVLELEENSEGLRIKARVDAQPVGSPLRHIYDAIKRGSHRGASIGGFFKRLGQKIVSVRLSEVSITALAVDPRTYVAATEVKGMGFAHSRAVKLRRAEVALDQLSLKLAALEFAAAVASARRRAS